MEKRIKRLAALSAVILPCSIALYFLLPATPAAALAIGLLFGLGASMPIGCMLALLTERQPKQQTTVWVSGQRWAADTSHYYTFADVQIEAPATTDIPLLTHS